MTPQGLRSKGQIIQYSLKSPGLVQELSYTTHDTSPPRLHDTFLKSHLVPTQVQPESARKRMFQHQQSTFLLSTGGGDTV